MKAAGIGQNMEISEIKDFIYMNKIYTNEILKIVIRSKKLIHTIQRNSVKTQSKIGRIWPILKYPFYYL